MTWRYNYCSFISWCIPGSYIPMLADRWLLALVFVSSLNACSSLQKYGLWSSLQFYVQYVTCTFNLQWSLGLHFFRMPSSILLVNWLVGVSSHGCKQWYQILPRKKCVLTGCFGFPSSPFLHLFPISSHPECLLLISYISSNCSPSSTTIHVQEDLLPSKSMGARWPSSPFSPSSPRTWLTAPHRCGPRWSRHHEWWAPHHPTSPSITSSSLHSPKISTLTPISEGPHHPQYKVG